MVAKTSSKISPGLPGKIKLGISAMTLLGLLGGGYLALENYMSRYALAQDVKEQVRGINRLIVLDRINRLEMEERFIRRDLFTFYVTESKRKLTDLEAQRKRELEGDLIKITGQIKALQ